MAKLELVEFQSEQGFDLVVKPTLGRVKAQGQNLNSIQIRFPHGRPGSCQVSRCFNYTQMAHPALVEAAEKHENRPVKCVPAAKPWRPCKSAKQNGQ
jgi:hypothetical protein